ncbi:MAG: glycosyltransferase family 2 protein [Luteolibacter sp.]|uniref:glycosyltransferase family 2 protein n=1 Tax=Luteolibacter sp. TaxID=1962973 RepID=UPI003262FD01
MNASIIIVTRDRADDLRLTLTAMREIRIPTGFEAELLVIDNGSTDATAEVVRSCEIPGLPVRYILETQPGLSRGRNRGLAEAKGDIILFTDDDVRPPADWLAGMCEPILSGNADAVAGGVRIAPNLLRPWMSPMHRSWLASSEWLNRGKPQSMVGANMVFSRNVLEKVPGFDPELGAGALGSGEESLFSAQLIAAGFRIADRTDLCMEHHFQPSRLKRGSWLDAAKKLGISHAYRGHHWEHWGCRWAKLRHFAASASLALWRATHSSEIRDEGCSDRELNLVYRCAMIRGHFEASKLPRKYEKHGLVKL